MKIYKISNIETKTSRGGKIITTKRYQNINHSDFVVVATKRSYVNLTHGQDNNKYSCLIETIRRIRKYT